MKGSRFDPDGLLGISKDALLIATRHRRTNSLTFIDTTNSSLTTKSFACYEPSQCIGLSDLHLISAKALPDGNFILLSSDPAGSYFIMLNAHGNGFLMMVSKEQLCSFAVSRSDYTIIAGDRTGNLHTYRFND